MPINSIQYLIQQPTSKNWHSTGFLSQKSTCFSLSFRSNDVKNLNWFLQHYYLYSIRSHQMSVVAKPLTVIFCFLPSQQLIRYEVASTFVNVKWYFASYCRCSLRILLWKECKSKVKFFLRNKSKHVIQLQCENNIKSKLLCHTVRRKICSQRKSKFLPKSENVSHLFEWN